MYIFIGTATSPNILDFYKKKSKTNSSFVQQKWDYFLCKALSAIEKENLKVFSFPATPTFPIGKNLYNKRMNEKTGELTIDYIGCSNLPLLKQINSSNYLYREIKKIIKSDNEVTIITHSLYPQTYRAIKRLKKQFNNFAVISMIPDLPEFSYPIWGKKHKILFYFWKLFNKSKTKLKSIPDGYVCFAKTQMAFLDNKPFIEMNGIVDIQFIDSIKPLVTQNKKRIIVYAGAINNNYGIQELIDGFVEFNNSNYELHFYGNGDLVDGLSNYKDKNVFYKGQVDREEMIAIEKSAFLLVNPRPTAEEYSKYSFPSKILEYMYSGRPVLSTDLLPLKDTFSDLVFFAGDGSPKDFCNGFAFVDGLETEQLKNIAEKARRFIKNNMTSSIQALRLISFCEEMSFNGKTNS